MSENKINKKAVIIAAAVLLVVAIAVAVGIAVSKGADTPFKDKDVVAVTDEKGVTVTDADGKVVTEKIEKSKDKAESSSNITQKRVAPEGSTVSYVELDENGKPKKDKNGNTVTKSYDDKGNVVTTTTTKPATTKKPSTTNESTTVDPKKTFTLKLKVILPYSPSNKDVEDTLIVTVNGKEAKKIKVTLKNKANAEAEIELKDLKGTVEINASLVDYGESIYKVIEMNKNISETVQINTVDKSTSKNGIYVIEGEDD